jgi:hypothetical protein
MTMVLLGILVLAIVATLAMGIWFVSLPLTAILVLAVGGVIFTRRRAGVGQVERFREQQPSSVREPPEEHVSDESAHTVYEKP